MELRVKQIAKQKGVSLTDLATKIGVSRRTMFNWVSNGNASFDDLKDIAVALGCSFYELMEPAEGWGYIFDDDGKFRGVIKKIGAFDEKGNFKGSIKHANAKTAGK